MNIVNRFLLTAVVTISNGTAAQPETSPLAPLGFLIGKWQSTSTPGIDVFRKELGGRIIVRSAQSAQVGPGDKPSGMHSVMTIYTEPEQTVRAIYFDDEGHVVHYRLANVGLSDVQFVSEQAGQGPYFRLTYARTDDRTMTVKFEMAMADHPGDFRTIAEATETRMTE